MESGVESHRRSSGRNTNHEITPPSSRIHPLTCTTTPMQHLIRSRKQSQALHCLPLVIPNRASHSQTGLLPVASLSVQGNLLKAMFDFGCPFLFLSPSRDPRLTYKRSNQAWLNLAL